ncbi:MAG TPA: hypothetical protein VL326_12505 [Kofleriaceae bacterium]|jgi:hypothetical protein|nr:hypothetical protein [Kofleriaceae bacterium]
MGNRDVVAVLGLASLVASAGCAVDTNVEVVFKAPANAASTDASCITAVEMKVIGANYAHDHSDVTRKCFTLAHPAANYAELRNAVHGQFKLDVPDSGLGGVSLHGLSGMQDACKEPGAFYLTPYLMFSADAEYLGQDELDLAVQPNLDCSMSQGTARVVDMLALAATGSSANCTSAMTVDNGNWVGVGTLTQSRFDRGTEFFGNPVGFSAADNAMQITSAPLKTLQPAPRSCLAVTGIAHGGSGIGCVIGGPTVCAGSGEMEIVAIPDNVRNHEDAKLKAQFPTITFGSVWNNGTPRTTIAGAKVTIDSKLGKVIYIDPPGADGSIVVRADQSTGTGPSGLFIVYADTIANVKIDAVGKSRTVTLGGSNETAGGAMVVMQ